jgi:membrane dipeptidase
MSEPGPFGGKRIRMPRHTIPIAISLALLLAQGAVVHRQDGDTAAQDHATLLERAHRLLRRSPLIDGHNDMPWAFRARTSGHLDRLSLHDDLSALDRPMDTDIPRMRAGGVGGQFWSVWIPIREAGGQVGDARTVIEQIDLVKRIIDAYPDDLELALTADDVLRVRVPESRRGAVQARLQRFGSTWVPLGTRPPADRRRSRIPCDSTPPRVMLG